MQGRGASELVRGGRSDRRGGEVRSPGIGRVESGGRLSAYGCVDLPRSLVPPGAHLSVPIELSPVRLASLADRAAGLGAYDTATGHFNVGFGGWDNSADVYNVVGGELAARTYPVEGLDIFANYAINQSFQQHAIPGTPDDQRTSRHKFNAGVQLRTKIGFNGEISFYYQSAQVWAEQVATLSGIVVKQFPLPAYTMLNGRVGWRFYKDRIEVSAAVFNALAGVGTDVAQQHPFGNRIGRRFMGFFSYSL